MSIAARTQTAAKRAIFAAAGIGLAIALSGWQLKTVSAATDFGQTNPPVELPSGPNSVKFAVIGDDGTGDQYQNQVAQQMVKARKNFTFDFVLMLGDNIYGGHTALDFDLKFAQPYKQLLDNGVKFYASLGNHDL